MTDWIKVGSGKTPPIDEEILVWEDNGLELPQIAYWNIKEGFYQFNTDDYSLNTDEFIYLRNVTHYAIITRPDCRGIDDESKKRP